MWHIYLYYTGPTFHIQFLTLRIILFSAVAEAQAGVHSRAPQPLSGAEEGE